MGVLDRDYRSMLMEARRRGIVRDFDIMWCIERGLFPAPRPFDKKDKREGA